MTLGRLDEAQSDLNQLMAVNKRERIKILSLSMGPIKVFRFAQVRFCGVDCYFVRLIVVALPTALPTDAAHSQNTCWPLQKPAGDLFGDEIDSPTRVRRRVVVSVVSFAAVGDKRARDGRRERGQVKYLINGLTQTKPASRGRGRGR